MKTLAAIFLMLLALCAIADEEIPDSPDNITPLIVDTAFVAEAIQRGAIVWDVRPPEEYRKLRVLRSENSEDFIAQETIETILGEAGIDPAAEVIVYGGKAVPSAYFGLYTLQYFGADNAHIFHGGIDDWKAAGRPLSAQTTDSIAIKLRLTARPEIAIDTGEVRDKLDRSEVQILDVRTQREFEGEDIRALRGGHIVGAINIPYERNMAGLAPRKPGAPPVNGKDALALKSEADLRALYALLDADKETIVYCQSGSRAVVTAAVLKDLGFKNVRVYDSSWLDYGNTLDAPAEGVKFFNVGGYVNRMNVLMKRVEELEKELAAIKENKK
jgi:thiosulfate/3-mercaptopyruvate sulfurtransferase